MLRIPLPPALVETAAAYASGSLEPAEPRNAATVVLLRPSASASASADGPEVYLLRRQASMAFAAGMCVFPGGGVDPRDFDVDVAWAGPSPSAWASRLGVDEALGRALVCAAVRETFEESGVLLAGTSASSVVSDTTGPEWESDRVALESRTLSFTSFLSSRGLVLRSDLLGAWSGWLTPEFEPRRYRTWFFVASLPSGQVTRDVSTESSSVTWMSAVSAASAVDAGELLMLPPTYLTCLEMGLYGSPADVLAAASSRGPVEMFMPEVEGSGSSASLSIPPSLRSLVEERFA
jgi:8-oxo-dGTP pyrophosphatase MutT (NUDIX family)